MHQFKSAHWSFSVKVISLIGTVALMVMDYFLIQQIPRGSNTPFAEDFGILLSFVAPLIILGAALFVVRGYELSDRQLRIRRLLWSTTIELGAVMAVWADPTVMRGSLKVWGNGGLFGITGLFRSKQLGVYRAFVTDPRRTVALKLERRVVVISPDRPERFVERAKGLFPRARFSREEEK